MSAYPEHDRLALISDKSQAIGEFIDWLQSKGIHLACYYEEDSRDRLFTVETPTNSLLAEFFDIDPIKIEREKRAMLDALRGGDPV